MALHTTDLAKIEKVVSLSTASLLLEAITPLPTDGFVISHTELSDAVHLCPPKREWLLTEAFYSICLHKRPGRFSQRRLRIVTEGVVVDRL